MPASLNAETHAGIYSIHDFVTPLYYPQTKSKRAVYAAALPYQIETIDSVTGYRYRQSSIPTIISCCCSVISDKKMIVFFFLLFTQARKYTDDHQELPNEKW